MAALAAERAVLAPSRRLLVEIFAPSITDPEAFIAGRVSLAFMASPRLPRFPIASAVTAGRNG